MRFFKRIELFSTSYCCAQLKLWGDALCYPVPSPSHLNPQLQSICMVRSPKSIAGAVGATLGNAPYSNG
ncbi:MAG: hypothetical protein DWQ58_16585 [Microcystis aeruginosa TA09]|nr:MAG: hypothetical protein DWQ58_16585 [Microcystis aeruginosa TA09]